MPLSLPIGPLTCSAAKPESDLRNTWPRRYNDNDNNDDHDDDSNFCLPSSPPLRRRLHHRQHPASTSAPVPAAAAAAAQPSTLSPSYAANGDANSPRDEYHHHHHHPNRRSSRSSHNRRSGDNGGGVGGGDTNEGGGESDDDRHWEIVQEATGGDNSWGVPTENAAGRRFGGRGYYGGGFSGPAVEGTPDRAGAVLGTANERKQFRQEISSREWRRQQASEQKTTRFDAAAGYNSIPSPAGLQRSRAGVEMEGSSCTPFTADNQYLSTTRKPEAASFDINSIPSPAGQAGCSPKPRSTRQAALLMRGAIRYM